MAKTKETKEAERLIYGHTSKMGTFGCFEVTLGWYGKEIVDYITYDTNSEIRCYEIKVSKSDFKSKAKLSFKGHFNYFIMPEKLYDELINENNNDLKTTSLKMWINSYGIGVYIFGGQSGWKCIKNAKRKGVTLSTSSMILESMLRSTNREMKKYYLEKPYWE